MERRLTQSSVGVFGDPPFLGSRLTRLAGFEALCSTLDLPGALFAFLKSFEREIPAQGVFVNIYDPDEEVVRFLAHATRERAVSLNEVVPLPTTLSHELSYQNRETCLVVDHIRSDPVTLSVLPKVITGVQSYVMLRLMMDGAHLGVVGFYSPKPNAFSKAHADFIQSFHNPLALVVARVITSRLKTLNKDLLQKNTALENQVKEVTQASLSALINAAPSFEALAPTLKTVAQHDATVLILGDSGTGKDVLANVIHQMSRRKNAPFVKVNCGAIPANLIESEFFGYEKGAFTDAKTRHIGFFEQADGGTIFLDEIGELPLAVQVKLLRVLQHKCFTRLGGERDIVVDVRIIAATNRDLITMLKEGMFREDLYYRLNIFPIRLLPLCERRGDIATLATTFLKRLAKKYRFKCVPHLSEKALATLNQYDWPGNARELENVLERTLLGKHGTSGDAPWVSIDEVVLGEEVTFEASRESEPEQDNGDQKEAVLLQKGNPVAFEDMTLEMLEREYFKVLLMATNGRIAGEHGAAQKAGLHPNTFRSRLQKLGLTLTRRAVVSEESTTH